MAENGVHRNSVGAGATTTSQGGDVEEPYGEVVTVPGQSTDTVTPYLGGIENGDEPYGEVVIVPPGASGQ